MKDKKFIGVVGIFSSYVGAVIGAGYASGQEILQFFNAFGDKGKYSIVIAALFFIIFGYLPMILAYKARVMDFEKLITPFGIKAPKYFSDFLITITQFGTLIIMVAAAGSMFNEMYGIPYWSGSLIVSILLVIVLFSGLDGIVRVLSGLVPIMVIIAFIVGVYGSVTEIPTDNTVLDVNKSPLIKQWYFSGILYVAYNFSIALGISVPMGFRAKSGKTIAAASIISGLAIGICAFVVYNAMENNIYYVGAMDLPMVAIAEYISPALKIVYSGILFIGLYSTAISCYYGFYSRAYKFKVFKRFGEKTLAIFIMAAALVLSQLGFSQLISYIYPALGYGSIIIMVLLLVTIYEYIKKKNLADTDGR